MMALAAKYMGYHIAVLDPTPDCPTAQVADEQITAAYDDMEAIRKLTEISDVVTYEFENVDLEAAAYIEQQGKLPQGAVALEITQNREKEKQLMKETNLPIPKFSIVTNARECEEALADTTLPAVIKTCSGGYDGKGQLKLQTAEDAPEAIAFAERNNHCIIEEWVTFDKEISVVFTRSQAREIVFFPIAENDDNDHILYQTTGPEEISEIVTENATDVAMILADNMDIVGTFAIEMFVQGHDIYLNEMAPRPHNSGHYTIEACNISQFAQHIRAICGLPLTPVKLLENAVMINILGEDLPGVLKAMPNASEGFIHLYGKEEAKEKRKMGHVTFTADTQDSLTKIIAAFEVKKQ